MIRAYRATGGDATGPLRIRFDYSLDSGNFFGAANQSRRALLQTAADAVVSKFADNLSAIVPAGKAEWIPAVFHPSSGATTLTVVRSGPPTGIDQSVSLSSSDPGELRVPQSAVIPGNATSVTVDVDAVDDALLDGDQAGREPADQVRAAATD